MGGRARRRKGKGNKLNSLVVVAVVMSFVVILGVQMNGMKAKNEELSAKKESLEKTYELESERTSQLEEQRIYVQTKAYIEDAAKKLGFVYPDEVILKPQN